MAVSFGLRAVRQWCYRWNRRERFVKMDRIKAAVLFDCDERQREELEAAGKDMVEFVYAVDRAV
mgnify:FL=1